jgi:hypothetical protein
MRCLTPRAQREMEELWKLRREAVEILAGIVAEWESDPKSVQCFDERIRSRAKQVCERVKKLDVWGA